MKCSNCQSKMFIADENVNSRSQITFYRCGVCDSEQVSSEPVTMADQPEPQAYFESVATDKKRYLMV